MTQQINFHLSEYIFFSLGVQLPRKPPSRKRKKRQLSGIGGFAAPWDAEQGVDQSLEEFGEVLTGSPQGGGEAFENIRDASQGGEETLPESRGTPMKSTGFTLEGGKVAQGGSPQEEKESPQEEGQMGGGGDRSGRQLSGPSVSGGGPSNGGGGPNLGGGSAQQTGSAGGAPSGGTGPAGGADGPSGGDSASGGGEPPNPGKLTEDLTKAFCPESKQLWLEVLENYEGLYLKYFLFCFVLLFKCANRKGNIQERSFGVCPRKSHHSSDIHQVRGTRQIIFLDSKVGFACILPPPPPAGTRT